jgi:6-pyruvoyltetrahydropterin/6-carboxytetrahydropterin synthase
MYELSFESYFSAAHNLRDYKGKCEKLHGHNWKIIVALRSDRLDERGMVMDFGDAKQLVGTLLEELDHTYLNDHEYFKAINNPTTENIARFFYQKIAENLPPHIRVSKVSIWESDKCSASYFE